MERSPRRSGTLARLQTMVGRDGNAAPSPLAEYFEFEVKRKQKTPVRDKSKPRKRNRSRSFGARAIGIQAAFLASRLTPLMRDNRFVRSWTVTPVVEGRKARVVVRRKTVLASERRKAARAARSRTKYEYKYKEWADSDKENTSPD